MFFSWNYVILLINYLCFFSLRASCFQILPAAVPFQLSDVKLDVKSHFGDAQRRNLEYISSLNNSQLTCIFTSAANLTHCTKSNCPSPGKASAPLCDPLPGEMGIGSYYGHYLGHWMSATAMMFANTRDIAIKTKSSAVVHTLSTCQEAWEKKYGAEYEGYLFPYDPIVFRILEEEVPHAEVKRIYSVPFYTVHKLMAGLLDQWILAGNVQAGNMVQKYADWVVRNVQRTLDRGGESLWQKVLNTEWGGMNEVMFNLYNITGNEKYLSTGYSFNHWSWSAPLATGQDDLNGNHANTHIPEVIGNARGYELTGNLTDKAVAITFFNVVTANHSWATGGSNSYEHWGAAQRMGDQLSIQTEESCTQYNILKMARHLFLWTANSTLFDFYERAIMNGILGNQNKLDPEMTKFIYMLPLGGGGIHKGWGSSNHGFPCCWGSLSEQFSKMADSIYFQSPDHTTIFINQFISSSVIWKEQNNVNITQIASFPELKDSTTKIIIHHPAISPIKFILKIRVPAWAVGNNTITINGEAIKNIKPGTYLSIDRSWHTDDTINVHYQMTLWTSPIQDTRPKWNSTLAFMYGPLVLAGKTESVNFIPHGSNPLDPSTFITRNSSGELMFEAVGKIDHFSPEITISMLPLFKIMEEGYVVYFRTEGTSIVPYKPGGSVVPSTSNFDLHPENGASSNVLVSDKLCSGVNIRSGNPGQHSKVTFLHPIIGNGHRINRITFQYRYSAGYTPQPGQHLIPANLSFVLLDQNQEMLSLLYSSSPLGNYSADHFTGYSPIFPVDVHGLDIPNENAVYVAFIFHNNQRNLQIPIDDKKDGFNIIVHWSKK